MGCMPNSEWQQKCKDEEKQTLKNHNATFRA